MGKTNELNERIRSHWNSLGFYYDRDDDDKKWKIAGSQDGIRKFCNLLEAYAKDESKIAVSEDRHFGPYSFLKFMTWTKAQIMRNELRGRPDDFLYLSQLIRKKLESGLRRFDVNQEYSGENDYRVVFVVKDSAFEPASEDPGLK